jgi:beta-lactam-binding protein with PASTA domain
MPRDSVISQTPAPGGSIKKGRQVRVVVSQGPSDMQAPKLVGEQFRKADVMVRQAGFFPGDVARVTSETVERDVVIAQAPEAGSLLEKGGTVSMLVSAGKKAQLFIMPKLTGKKAEEAVKLIDRMGLQHRVISRAARDATAAAQERTVVSQKPGAGHPVAADAMVELIVSK